MPKIQFDVNVANGVAIDVANVVIPVYLHRLSIFWINCTENGECVMTAWIQSLCKSEQRHLYRSAKRVWSCRYQWLERLSLCTFQT